MWIREAFKKQNPKKCDKCHTCSEAPPPTKCDEKPSEFFGQKWPFQEVKIFDFNHAIICQSLQSIFENFLAKISWSEPLAATNGSVKNESVDNQRTSHMQPFILRFVILSVANFSPLSVFYAITWFLC